MKYGDLPEWIGEFEIKPTEMCFYQYLPVKMADSTDIQTERRLKVFWKALGCAACAYVGEYGLNRFKADYMYLTAKYMWQGDGCSYNRTGWHSDGFMTDDINYIWSDRNPTVFNSSNFNLTFDDKVSMLEMEQQALPENDICYPNNAMLRLNQYNIHRVNPIQEAGMRTFIKVSFSKDRYDLVGNSHNYKFKYDWKMRERNTERNIPQAG